MIYILTAIGLTPGAVAQTNVYTSNTPNTEN
jgi:hypothetical protein